MGTESTPRPRAQLANNDSAAPVRTDLPQPWECPFNATVPSAARRRLSSALSCLLPDPRQQPPPARWGQQGAVFPTPLLRTRTPHNPHGPPPSAQWHCLSTRAHSSVVTGTPALPEGVMLSAGAVQGPAPTPPSRVSSETQEEFSWK